MKTEDYISSLNRMRERMWVIYMTTRDDVRNAVAYEMSQCFEEEIARLRQLDLLDEN